MYDHVCWKALLLNKLSTIKLLKCSDVNNNSVSIGLLECSQWYWASNNGKQNETL